MRGAESFPCCPVCNSCSSPNTREASGPQTSPPDSGRISTYSPGEPWRPPRVQRPGPLAFASLALSLLLTGRNLST